MFWIFILITFCLCVQSTPQTITKSDYDYDVLVYGSTPAGISAAIAASSLGMKVGLFEPLKMIGGMGAAGNLALNDGGMAAERTGLALQFSLTNGQHYYGTSTKKQVPHPESFVANATFYSMLTKANVSSINLDCRLLSVATKATAISSITVNCLSKPVTSIVFIDASYDGEIMINANNTIDYTFGRESIATYNESLAGARKPSWQGVNGPKGINPFDVNGNLLPYVDNITELVQPGLKDDRLMAFQHRLCISGDEKNTVQWPKPTNYDREDFQLLQKSIDADHGNVHFFTNMPPSRLPGLPLSIEKFCLCCVS